ncbi:hypothetical protein D3C78_1146880 [compost metagenome]
MCKFTKLESLVSLLGKRYCIEKWNDTSIYELFESEAFAENHVEPNGGSKAKGAVRIDMVVAVARYSSSNLIHLWQLIIDPLRDFDMQLKAVYCRRGPVVGGRKSQSALDMDTAILRWLESHPWLAEKEGLKIV